MFIRRLSTVAAGAAAVIALSVIPATASASAGGNDDLQACRGSSAVLPSGYIGACTSYFRSSSDNSAAATAYFCRIFLVSFVPFATQGACVSEIVEFGGVDVVLEP